MCGASPVPKGCAPERAGRRCSALAGNNPATGLAPGPARSGVQRDEVLSVNRP